ncbi:MAG: hypothetical protein GY820_46265 [Gammaproteobacteria bacterium]|nr:hypothetical protein [Gammaproteobacteria bacterium]
MDESLIKSVHRTPVVPDALKKREQERSPKSVVKQKQKKRKDPKRIIDTYA